MGKKNNLCETVVREVAESFGGAIVETGKTGSNHSYAVIKIGARRRKVFYPSTPSDRRRGHLNLRCDLRKAIGAML